MIMKESLVELTTTVPEGTDPAEVSRRRADESVRAKEFAATGHLVRLWRPVGELLGERGVPAALTPGNAWPGGVSVLGERCLPGERRAARRHPARDSGTVCR